MLLDKDGIKQMLFVLQTLINDEGVSRKQVNEFIDARLEELNETNDTELAKPEGS